VKHITVRLFRCRKSVKVKPHAIWIVHCLDIYASSLCTIKLLTVCFSDRVVTVSLTVVTKYNQFILNIVAGENLGSVLCHHLNNTAFLLLLHANSLYLHSM
jgi:hypothetical protein